MSILDECIDLKEQKVILDQEKCHLDHERLQCKGQHCPSTTVISSAAAKSAAFVPQIAGQPLYSTPAMMPTSKPSVSHINCQVAEQKKKKLSSFCTPTTNQASVKRRKGSNDVPNAPITAKRSRGHLTTNHLTITTEAQSSPCVHDGSPVQGSSVAKCLFNQQNESPPTNLSVPKIPLRATSSRTNKSASSLENSSTATFRNDVSPQQTISTDCIVISSETIRVNPVKHLTYYSI